MILYIYPDGSRIEEPDKKFSCGELIEFFKGWFTLRCVENSRKSGELYLCSLDPHGINPKDLPELNKPIKKMFNRDVCGVAILASSNMF